MHELSIALSILDIATQEAKRRGCLRISAIHVQLGPLAGVVKEALLSAFDLAREVSSAADARLVIDETPIVVYCKRCAAEQPIASIQDFCCPKCGTYSAHVVSGRELDIVALEIDEPAVVNPHGTNPISSVPVTEVANATF
jgi:hydrogenase nickel incorporation protein HypA/HybF